MAIYNTISASSGAIIYMEQSKTFRSFLSEFFECLRYLKILIDCFTSPKITMWRSSEQMRRIAELWVVGILKSSVPYSLKK